MIIIIRDIINFNIVFTHQQNEISCKHANTLTHHIRSKSYNVVHKPTQRRIHKEKNNGKFKHLKRIYTNSYSLIHIYSRDAHA